MMELKGYQEEAIQDLEDFIRLVDENNPLKEAYKIFWESRDVPAKPPYKSTIAGVPQVCFKVPTGGGKTFMAAASIKSIFLGFPATKRKVVVWLVPSETILTQTYKNLSDPAHPYNRRLQMDFSENVKVYNKEQLLMGEEFSPATVESQVSIFVLSYDSFRTVNKDGRKAYQENGQLLSFMSHLNDEDFLLSADECSLINVIRHYKPVVIIDESHHATTKLSVEMLENFNPSFVLELTATPKENSNIITYVPASALKKENSNIITYVPASALKKENMVKLPVILYNRHNRDEVIEDALSLRKRLEQFANNETMQGYNKIRPIVLFQAESKGKGDRATFDKIKTELIENYKVPSEQIAIKTAEINELPDDLMAKDCPIRYIITINALKEGWDCSFAYILASLANRSSPVDVEQIVGRILRRPYTKQFDNSLLNMCYVFTASEDFRDTVTNVIKGLNAAGFSDKECRPAEEWEISIDTETTTVIQTELYSTNTNDDLPTSTVESVTSNANDDNDSVSKMEHEAYRGAADYDAGNDYEDNERAPEVKEKMTEFPIQEQFKDAEDILLPKFFISENAGIFGVEDIEIKPNRFYKQFPLSQQDTIINFDDLNYEISLIDIQDKEYHPRHKMLNDSEAKTFLKYFETLPRDSQIRECVETLKKIIDRRTNAPSTEEIRKYIYRVVENFDKERLHDAMEHSTAYARRIKEKIEQLMTEFAREKFNEQIDEKKIFAKPSYKLKQKISPTNFTKDIFKSLYVAESNDMNDFEYNFIAKLVALDNVRWWHRNRERKEFCINGFINHYPDFLVMMNSGVLLLIETKGDDRDNSDSRRKLELGNTWEKKAGSDKYSYFMVFDKKPLEGAISFNNFMQRAKSL